jgi:agmatinase
MSAHVTLLGIPWDRSSTFQRGAAAAPDAIRAALWSPSSNPWNEYGDDLSQPGVLVDAGNLVLPEEPVESRDAISKGVARLVADGQRPLILGGDHSITYPVLRAWQGRSPALTVLHFDAHGDLYDEYEGDRYSHASPFARVMEQGLAARLIQVGVRAMTAHLRTQAERFGVEVYGPAHWRDAIGTVQAASGPIYISLDIDVLEPMLGPGVSHPEPGGLSVREVLEVLSAIRAPAVGADIVEYNPVNDVRDLTARVAAKFVKELVGVLRASSPTPGA